ncbi:uncharacterized protein B0T15DRAFT_574986 [Chaetomium strumarium]|uniref:Uncharacterized protein n=1 Tax=Chaetomium strumarium TaxID=1170767 RepID=A0AAJ0GT78_9PEZI|nr:hypothetical protein B0T15DRAFT_574986 [Chaetomium strumarium]
MGCGELRVPMRYGDTKARWFNDSIQEFVDQHQIYEKTGLWLPTYMFRGLHVGNSSHPTEYLSEAAYFPVDENQPHIASFIIDSNEAPGDQVLRNEVDYAITLVKYRLAQGRHTNHHTKPATIYTIERESFARITQAYFDGKTNKLVLRQLRHLDLWGPKPPDDAYTLLRWMANHPCGHTEYVDEDEPEEEANMTTDSSDTVPKLLLGQA